MTTWRLEDYLNLQSFACFWGLVPGSITDENSPFNECSHAYLAAGRALLLQLNREPGADHKAIDALISKIEVEMLADRRFDEPAAAIATSRSTPTRLSGRIGAWRPSVAWSRRMSPRVADHRIIAAHWIAATGSRRRSTTSNAQNVVLALAEISGIGSITSQCSTTLPPSNRKMSTTASPRGLSDRPCQ